MPSLQMIEVIIGLLFLYLLSVTVVLAFNEIFAYLFNLRHKGLMMGINALLLGDDKHQWWRPFKSYAKGVELNSFFNNPFIKNLGNKNKITKIPPKTFASAILTCLGYDVIDDHSSMNLKEDVKKIVQKLIAHAGGDFNGSIANIEEWYNNTMEVYCKYWYKSLLSAYSLLLFIIPGVLLLNLDSIMIARELWTSNFTDKVIENTFKYFQPDPTSINHTQQKYHQILDELNVSKNQIYRNYKIIGWHTDSTVCTDPRALPANFWDWCCKIIGLLITTLAISLGAPFWFDILNKILPKET